MEKGETLFVVETEKITSEIESVASGILRKILAPVGSEVEVGAPIAIISESPDEELPEIEEVKLESLKEEPAKIKISPAARRLAQMYNIDITKIKGTGPNGRIIKRDILRAIEELKIAKTILPKIKEIIPLSGIKKTMAEKLSTSFKSAVHTTITMEVDATNLVKVRNDYVAKGYDVTYTDIMIKLCSEALKKYPLLNSSLDDGKIIVFEDVNIGVAVALEDGLIVPVIHNADKKTILEIASITKSLIKKARSETLSLDDVSGGTFTLSNLGMFGVDVFTPIINPPQVAILGLGRIAKKPVIVDDKIEIRSMMMMSLTFDHRVIEGALAAQFLRTLKSYVENPSSIIR